MTGQVRDRLGRFGIWRGGGQVTAQLAADIEKLGFGALWLGTSPSGDLVQPEELLDATGTLVLATSIVNMWVDPAATVAASFARVAARQPGRFLLGVGAGHREVTQQYASPLETLTRYVDVLRGDGVPRDGLVLAALGRKVLTLAAERTAGAIPIWSHPSTPGRPARSSARGRCSPPSRRWCLTPTRSGPGHSAGPACAPISGWSTTPATCAAWAGPTMTWPAAAVTRWSTR